MRQRLRAMIRKEFLQVFRDPRMRGMLFLPPLIQLLIFGYAANLDVNTARIAWMDQDHSPQSRELYSQFLGSGRFIIAAMPASESGNAGRHGSRPRRRRDPRAARIRPRYRARPSHQRPGAAGRQQFQCRLDRLRLRRPDHRALYRRGHGGSPAAKAGGGRRAHASGGSPGVHRNARLVQSRAQEPELFHPRRDRQHHHAGDAVADHHGHRAGKRAGDHGAADGHADPSGRADSGQDAAVRPDRLLGHAAGAGRRRC